MKPQIQKLLEFLTLRERQIIILRFGLEDGKQRTLEEVGKEFGVTRERIRQLEARAIRRINHSTKKYLREQLPEPSPEEKKALIYIRFYNLICHRDNYYSE